MTIPTIEIHTDIKCKQCGKKGACKSKSGEYTICLECAGKNIGGLKMENNELTRFEHAPNEIYEIMNEVIMDHIEFSFLKNAKILILLDTKKRVSMKKIVLGKMSKTNDLTRRLSISEEIFKGYDYIMQIDKLAWQTADDETFIRLIRHELRHCENDRDKDNPFSICAHDIEDFYIEIQLNQDDPKWNERLGNLVAEKYNQIEREKTTKQRGLFN